MWGIWDLDTGKPYLKRFWDTRDEALHERYELLRPYPQHSDWRRRLKVKEAPR